MSTTHLQLWTWARRVSDHAPIAVCGEGVEDLVGGLGPDEGFGVGVLDVDPLADVGFEFGDAAVGGAAEFAVGEFGEPAFDQVEPRAQRDSPVHTESAYVWSS